MSFSKARIQRFNEFENDVPPPGAYDPKFDSKVKGSVIEKSERFNDNKSVGSADGNLSVCTKHACIAANNFKTPQLPRKQNRDYQTRSTSKIKRTLISTNDQKLKYQSENHLADLQVECSNKDKTIQELEHHIEDMKEEVQKLELQLEELRKKQTEVETQHRRDIESMAKLQQEILNGYDEKHQTEVKNLRSQLLEVSEEKEREIETRKAMEGDLRNRITDFSKRIVALESEFLDKKNTDVETIQFLKVQIEELTTQLEKTTISHIDEINLLEQEKSQLNSCISNLTDERDKLELRLQKRQNVILELQGQLSTLQCELDELKAEYEKIVENSSKEINDLKYKHEEEIDKLKIEFEKQKIFLINKEESEIKIKNLNEENNFLKEELENVQKLYKDVNNRLREAHQELEDSDRKHNLILKKHKEDLADLIITRDKEIVDIKEAADKKIEEETKRIKQHADKMIENAEVVTRETLAACRTECEERVKRVIAESDAKINAMIREAKITVEEEMRLTAERYKTCLARVEMERAALDEKLAQKDAEITRLSVTLEELRSSAETQESFGQSLQMELDRAETELAEKKEELRVIMAENQASVAALTTRLAQSTAEVERLQHELKLDKDCINEHRDLLSIMRNNSQMVHEQVHVLMEQLDAKKGLVDQLEAESLSEVESLRSILEAKIDDLRKIATREVAALQAENNEITVQNVEMKKQLHEMSNYLTEAQDMLLKLEERNDAQELETSQVQMLNNKLNEQLKERETVIEDMNKLLEEQSKKHEITLNEANSKMQELSDKIKCLEENNTYTQENVELLEEERNKWKNFEKVLLEQLEEEKVYRETIEEEVKKLSKYNEQLLKDYKEIHEKYAEIVGHQNHKQRIKHVSQLKDKINQLEQDLYAKMRTIKQQQKTIEKLQAEEKRAYSKGKENMLGLSQSTYITPLSSPHKPITPLRNRND
ncbi:hypothetical protein APICC_04551 [Apis cerana cerana]|uniref:Hyaluronan-mediated motility receptor C-terminal domain-containing protein n=1 Tax=Apis cerana cerana TaxID=94128 RepID=A0A2A3EH28_APICC|nr:hypothetical protein APICC_04551 [Apis cerana cerana]